MERDQIRNKLICLLNDYLNSAISRDEMHKTLLIIQSPAEIADNNDELIIESYFALYHMDEVFCEVSDTEFEYLRDCLEGKRPFSKYERDKIISRRTYA